MDILCKYVEIIKLALCVFLNEQLVLPLFGNNKNQDTWPEVVTKDVLRHVHGLQDTVQVMTGRVKGNTILPLPAGSDQVHQVVRRVDRSVKFKNLVRRGHFTKNSWTIQL